MSNRGNHDYYKISGTPTEQGDVARMAHQAFARERSTARRNPGRPTGPQSVPVRLARPPKFKRPDEERPFGRTSSDGATRDLRDRDMARSGGFTPPSIGEMGRMALSSVVRLGGWA